MVQQNKSLRQRMRGINPRVQQWMRNAKTPEDHEIERLRAQLATARQEGVNEGLEMAAHAQPSTAADPNTRDYDRGYFDGVMAYGKAIRALKTPTPGASDA